MNNDLLIIYGTETGNSELLAMDAKKIAKNHGIEARYFAMDEIDANDLKKASTCMVICSTWGDGEQPDNAQELYDEVCSFEQNDLSGLKYAVLALGDTAFDWFARQAFNGMMSWLKKEHSDCMNELIAIPITMTIMRIGWKNFL